MSCLPLNSVPGNDLKLKSVFPRKSDLCSVWNTRTHAHTRRSLPLHKRNWHCHNSHLPHITQSSCVAAQWDPCPSACLSVWVRAWGVRKGDGGEWLRWQISWQRNGFDCMWADSQGTNCATKEATREYVCQPELDALALHALTKVTLMGFCSAQERMRLTLLHVAGGHRRLQRPEEAVSLVFWQLCSGYGPPSAYWGILLMRIDVRFVTLILSIIKVPCLHNPLCDRCILGRKKTY